MASSSSSSLAPGFRFHPTDEELVIYYLKRKICGKPFRIDAISEVDIYKFEPWDLPDRSRLKSRDLEWYFFSGLDKKYGNGWRTNRATDQGYWKTTGKDRPVHHGEKTVGMKKTLVFHIGRAPHGERTNWVMHEYRLVDEELVQAGVVQDAFVLCRVFRKSGPGPKNGERYGAPFLEEEWDDSVSNVKNEFENDAYSGLGDNEYVQPQQEYYEDHALATIPPNELPVGPDGGEGWNHPENYGGSSEDDKKVFIGTGEISGMMELPDEKMFVVPEQFQLDQRPNENEYFSVDDFLNTVDGSNQAENHLDGELRYSNASQDPLVFDESFITVDDPNSFEADQDPFKMLDEYIKYFDATDNDSNLVVLDSPEVSEFGVPYLNQSAFAEEVNAQNEQVCLAPPESPETHGDEGASSSEQTPEIPKITEDGKYNSGWDSTIAKQVSRMLGSIPAPTAFAGEIPTKEAAFGQSSSSSIHVTAGMIHISGMTVGGEKLWSLGKSGNADLLLPYRMTMGDVNLLGNSFGPMGNTLSSKASSVVLRSGFYFMFLWVLILSVSCKIGSYIYARQYL